LLCMTDGIRTANGERCQNRRLTIVKKSLVICHESLAISRLEHELHLHTSSNPHNARALLMSGCSLQHASQLLARADGARRSDVPRARCSAAMAKTGLPALEGLKCPYRYRSLFIPHELGIFGLQLEHHFLDDSGCSKLAFQKRHFNAVT